MQIQHEDFYDLTDLSPGRWKKVNMFLLACYHHVLPNWLRDEARIVFAHSIIRGNFHNKNEKYPPRWSDRSITGPSLKKLMGRGDSESGNYYAKKIKVLVDNNIYYRFRLNYTKYGDKYVQFVTYERHICSWRFCNKHGFLAPLTALSVAKSHGELCEKVYQEANKHNKNFNIDLVYRRFALWLGLEFARRMNHEVTLDRIPAYGDRIPERSMGPLEYIEGVFIPSVTKLKDEVGPYAGCRMDEVKIPRELAELIQLFSDSRDRKRKHLVRTSESSSPVNNPLPTGESPVNNPLPTGVSSGQQSVTYRSPLKKKSKSLKKKTLQKTNNAAIDTLKNIDTYKLIDKLFKEKQKKKKRRRKRKKKKETITMNVATKEEDTTTIIPNLTDALIGKVKQPKIESEKQKVSIKKISRPKKLDPLNNSADLVALFKRTVKKHFPSTKKYIDDLYGFGDEAITAGVILDLLYKNNSRDEETIFAWIDWYVQSLKFDRLNRKFKRIDLSLRSMKDSWSQFQPLRPMITVDISKETSGVVENVIRNNLDKIFKSRDNIEKKLMMALRYYGIPITVRYVEYLDENIMPIKDFLDKHVDNDELIRAIYESSELFEYKEVLKDEVVSLADWEDRFEHIWYACECISHGNRRGRNSKSTKCFFEGFTK